MTLLSNGVVVCRSPIGRDVLEREHHGAVEWWMHFKTGSQRFIYNHSADLLTERERERERDCWTARVQFEAVLGGTRPTGSVTHDTVVLY